MVGDVGKVKADDLRVHKSLLAPENFPPAAIHENHVAGQARPLRMVRKRGGDFGQHLARTGKGALGIGDLFRLRRLPHQRGELPRGQPFLPLAVKLKFPGGVAFVQPG